MPKPIISKEKPTFLKKYGSALFFVLNAILVPLIFLIVKETGGIKYAYSHLMYIPIVLAGVIYGSWAGALFSILGGLLLGPIMPVSYDPYETQLWYNWVTRLAVFIIVGVFSGIYSDILRHRNRTIQALYSKHLETDIPNKHSLNHAVTVLKPGPKIAFTILITNTMKIFDAFGSDVYLEILKQMYANLRQFLSKNDVIVLADDSKFWLILDNKHTNEEIQTVLGVVSRPIMIGDVPPYVSISIGVAQAETAAEVTPTLFRKADIAARLAEQKYQPYVVYQEVFSKMRSNYDLLGSFKNALANHDTFLVYQPKINLKTMEAEGIEALIRWQHPQRGVIMPEQFIPLVEETQLINDLTEWVLREAIIKAISMHQRKMPVRMAINISAKNLFNPTFFNRIMTILRDCSLPPESIEFELTETMLVTNPDVIRNALQTVAANGHHIAIDDFGIGYSSLSYLTQFPIDYVKIDKSFMVDIVRNPKIQDIVKSTINLAHQLGYKVIAEGIESSEVLHLLQTLDCDYGQGFYISRPIHSEAIDKWYKANM